MSYYWCDHCDENAYGPRCQCGRSARLVGPPADAVGQGRRSGKAAGNGRADLPVCHPPRISTRRETNAALAETAPIAPQQPLKTAAEWFAEMRAAVANAKS